MNDNSSSLRRLYLMIPALVLAIVSLSGRADSSENDWPVHGQSHQEQRFSLLDQVTTKNVHNLQPEWYLDIPSIDDGLAATPIIRDGIIYMSSSFANIYAVDAANGEPLWHYDPQTSVHSGFSNSWAARVNRGVAVADGLVFVGTPDCRLVAVSAKSGELRWQTLTCDPSAEYAITGAPRVANGKVFIGNGISDFGARGYVSAYDAATGDFIWRFWTVPGNPDDGHENEIMEMAAETWADGWAPNGGASAWDAIVFDPEFNQLYIGTDSAIPYDPSERSPGGGDHLFTNSIIALDADTGAYKWHYQTVPNDAWDYNAANHIILADLQISGESRQVLMQAPKNGFFYVLDRQTGALISARPYIGVTWATHIDLKTGRPVERPEARYYKNQPRRATIVPSLLGGHNWHPMSYNPPAGLVYIPAHEFKTTYWINPDAKLGGVMSDYYGDDLDEKKAGLKPETQNTIGRLIAWDPVRAEAKWAVNHELPMNGGVMSSAGGLVFQGTATGQFNAYDANTGKRLWSYDVQASVQAPPVSYRIDDKQYVLAAVGGSGIARFMVPLYGTGKNALGPSRLVAFTLDGRDSLPAPVLHQAEVPRPPELTASAEDIRRGAEIYEVAACSVCHASVAVGRRPLTSVPDLRYMTPETHKDFRNIVLRGYRRPTGMISYDGLLDEADVDVLHAFLISRQWELYQQQNNTHTKE
ncbi:MAG: PQQ-dependent dehydrogenase, methanol/ethanol family [Gammaproteobacteria bacterium]|nr:PQQ-dependent dehydrogenase, methanol/ethanol family [Gammaproteobacteria bacterium]